MSFNVATEAWLPVKYLGETSVQRVSLEQVFSDVELIEDLAIDFHVERQAVTNLLIALWYRTVSLMGNGDYYGGVQAVLAGASLGDGIRSYLSSQHSESGRAMVEHFDMFDLDYPFLQIPYWTSGGVIGRPSPAPMMAFFSEIATPEKSGAIYANHFAGQLLQSSVNVLSPADAVVPLIWGQQGWAVKTGSAIYLDGTPVHPSAKKGGLYQANGRDGTFFVAPHLCIVGKNLRDTLLLSAPNFENMENDSTIWEQTAVEQGFFGRYNDEPRGPADVILFSRCGVLLIRDPHTGDVVGAHYSTNNAPPSTKDYNESVLPTGSITPRFQEIYDWMGPVPEGAPNNVSITTMTFDTGSMVKSASSAVARFHPTAFGGLVQKGSEAKQNLEMVWKNASPVLEALWEGVAGLVALDSGPANIRWMRELVDSGDWEFTGNVAEIRYTSAFASDGKITSISTDTLFLSSALATGAMADRGVLAEVGDGVSLVLDVRNRLGSLEKQLGKVLSNSTDSKFKGIPVRIVGGYMAAMRPRAEGIMANLSADATREEVAVVFRRAVLEEALDAVHESISQLPLAALVKGATGALDKAVKDIKKKTNNGKVAS